MSSMNLQKQLHKAFGKYSNRTPEYYSRQICNLIRFHDRLDPGQMEQWHIDAFLAHLVRPGNYSRSYTNTAARAIKIFFSSIDNPMNVTIVSTQDYLKIPDTLSRGEVDSLLNELPPLYRLIVNEIYSLTDPDENDTLKRYPSRGSFVHRQTVNQKLKLAGKWAGITKSTSIRTVRLSGIIHMYQDTNDPALVAKKAGLKNDGRQFAKYIKMADRTLCVE